LATGVEIPLFPSTVPSVIPATIVHKCFNLVTPPNYITPGKTYTPSFHTIYPDISTFSTWTPVSTTKHTPAPQWPVIPTTLPTTVPQTVIEKCQAFLEWSSLKIC